MMPCFLHTEKTSPNCMNCYLPWKNGCRAQSSLKDKDILIQLPLTDDSTQSQSSLEKSESDQQYQQFLLEGKELIQKLEMTGDLGFASSFVQKHKEALLPLKNNGLCLRLCGLNDTIYMGQKFMLEGWENIYLPKRTRMEVLGTLENTESRVTGLQWIILLGEDGRVYAYEDEELHLVAETFRQFVEDGIQNTENSYSYPHDVSDEEDESVQHDEEIQKIRQRTRDFIDQSADEFDDFLNFLSS